ncbi:MAG: long-chain fatty acid--CoA ligase [Proteobacteria bacterium]|nr:long-chain fatty acid--CoA ligase [Pseudomonadota bacterium]MBU4471415.1 long-chain fatty acid--CoA ligase [Pseudomonadota bacterium]MCG2752420.1 long-chain fatty acid--CoA ligase [Desulfobacteraceae bacterium]
MENQRPWTRHYDYNVPLSIRYPRWTTLDLIQLSANKNPDLTATHFLGAEMTFWELRIRILKMANALTELGVKKGDRVGVHLPTSPQHIISFFSVTSLGAIVVNLNPMYTVEELKSLALDTGMTSLITSESTLDNVRKLCLEVDLARVIVTCVTDFASGMEVSSAKTLDLEKGWHHFSTLMDQCTNTKLPRVDLSFNDPAVIQFTGGTTGIPKGAVLNHSNIVAATFQCALWGNATIRDIPIPRRSVLGVLPFFHVYGMIVVMCSSIFNCATQILVPKFDLEEMMEFLRNFKEISFFPSVPTMINAIISHPKAEALELGKKFGVLNSGAAPIAREVIDKIKDAGIFFSEGWGMSETTALGISNPQLGLKKAGSIGVPFPDTDIRIVDVEDGIHEVKKGDPGEILIRSPLLMKGYWNRPEETALELKDGWLHTGDVAVQDEDDYFFIVDRKKDLIIAGGYNVYPREVDEVLYQHPKIADAVTVGIPDAYRGETIKSYIVLKPGESVDAEDIVKFSREKLAAYKVPRVIEFRETLPKSAVGKILRKELRREEEQKLKNQ